MADSRPDPGPLTRTSTTRNPTSFALDAAVIDACWAANGVPLRDPRNPNEPALDHEIVLPSGSEIVTIVLLKVACTWTVPVWTVLFSFFLKDFFFVAFAVLAVLAGAFAIMSYQSPSSCWPRCRAADPCGCARWYGCAVREPAARAGAACRDTSPSRCVV